MLRGLLALIVRDVRSTACAELNRSLFHSRDHVDDAKVEVVNGRRSLLFGEAVECWLPLICLIRFSLSFVNGKLALGGIIMSFTSHACFGSKTPSSCPNLRSSIDDRSLQFHRGLSQVMVEKGEERDSCSLNG